MAQVVEAPPLNEEEIQELYEWVDEIPLSRPKRNISRDFADAKMMAEIIKHFHPKLVELHNYPQAHSVQQKTDNWNTLNKKVFRRMGFLISKANIQQVVNCAPEAIEKVLKLVRQRIENFEEQKEQKEEKPRVESKPKVKAPKQGNKQHNPNLPPEVQEKEQVIKDLRDTIDILENKIEKLEHLVKLKDSKIQVLTSKLSEYE